MSPAQKTPWSRLVVLAFGLVAVVAVFILAFLWPTVTSSVRSLPIAIVGEPAQVAALKVALAERSPETFSITEAGSRDDAVDLIQERRAYGAIVLGVEPEVLTASAASPIVSQMLAGFAPQLQTQLNVVAAAQGIQLPAPIVVEVTDVVALSSDDPRGTILAASSFPIVLGGMIGGIALSIAVVGIWRRVVGVAVYSVVGGFVIAGIMQGWFGALQGTYLCNVAALSLALLSISGVIAGAVSIFGRPGIAVGPVLFLLIANPISAAAQPIEFLAQPWGALGQWFPPGATATLLRNLSYFPAAETVFPWLVLVGWAVLGILLATLGHFRQAARRVALTEESA